MEDITNYTENDELYQTSNFSFGLEEFFSGQELAYRTRVRVVHKKGNDCKKNSYEKYHLYHSVFDTDREIFKISCVNRLHSLDSVRISSRNINGFTGLRFR